MNVLQQGWVEIPKRGYVHSHLYFKILYLLAKLLSLNFASPDLRNIVCTHFGVSPVVLSSHKTAKRFELLRASERRGVLGFIELLLQDWPYVFINFLKAERVSLYPYGFFIKGMKFDDLPFWFWSEVDSYVIRWEYRESYDEDRARVNYIYRHSTESEHHRRLYKMLYGHS
jgi:hypothetical protein